MPLTLPLAAVPSLTVAVRSGPVAWRHFQAGIDAQFLADMGEFGRVGETAIGHHAAQFGETGVGEKQPRQALAGVEPHQPAFQQPFGVGGQLRLAGLRTAAPGFQLKAFGHARQRREEHVEFTADILPFTRREAGGRCGLWLAHRGPVSMRGGAEVNRRQEGLLCHRHIAVPGQFQAGDEGAGPGGASLQGLRGAAGGNGGGIRQEALERSALRSWGASRSKMRSRAAAMVWSTKRRG
jgi:hypothetical protein